MEGVMEQREKGIRDIHNGPCGVEDCDFHYLLSIIDSLRAEVEGWRDKAEFAKEGVSNLTTELIAIRKAFLAEGKLKDALQSLLSDRTNSFESVDIEKLQVEVEGLRKERNRLANDFNYAHEKKKELQFRLSDLLTAAEPFQKYVKAWDKVEQENNHGSENENDLLLQVEKAIIRFRDLRTLSIAVDRVKEGK